MWYYELTEKLPWGKEAILITKDYLRHTTHYRKASISDEILAPRHSITFYYADTSAERTTERPNSLTWQEDGGLTEKTLLY